MTGLLARSAITVGPRVRSEMGDLPALAASIKQIGLLHPVVVTGDHRLVAGERRLRACELLGWAQVPVTVVDLASAADLLSGEAEENTQRLDFSPVEAARMRERVATALAPKAKANQGGKGRDRSAKLAERSGETRKLAAAGTGYSGSTLDKVDEIRAAADDETQPEPVRQVAREQVARLSEPHRRQAVDPAHKAVRQAQRKAHVEQVEDAAPDTLAEQRHRLLRDLRPITRLATDWEPATVAALTSDPDSRVLVTECRKAVVEFLDAVIATWPKNLQAVRGGRS